MMIKSTPLSQIIVIILIYINISDGQRLSPNDPNSFSNPETVKVDHMHLTWNVDFTKEIISGNIVYKLSAVQPPVKKIVFDTRGLNIIKVASVDGKALDYTLGDPVLNFGQPLSVDVTGLFEKSAANLSVEIRVDYETLANSSALQWLEKEQTAGKKLPYLFSQCAAIQTRSLLPCQDTPFVKSSYSADITVPSEFTVLMSAAIQSETKHSDVKKTIKFLQKVPIQSYLIAMVVGNIKGQKIGPRSTIWSEPETLESAVYEFQDTEKMLVAAEEVFGNYEWDVFDILVLPPSFIFGGMENPSLTFLSPTLITGDRSLVSTVVHEICHSWTGNLVTNANFEHFWLNEGWTTFAERKILGRMHGEEYRQFTYIEGWKDLLDVVTTRKSDSTTILVPDFTNKDPDEVFSKVPYEKGAALLYYLEKTVGGAVAFDPFLKRYIQSHRFKSIDSNEFKSFFIDYFTKQGLLELIKVIDWDAWLYKPGMPVVKQNYDQKLAIECKNLKNKWIQWKTTEASPFSKKDFENFLPQQIVVFLAELLEEKVPLNLDKVMEMQKAYDFNSNKNSEIRYRWSRLCIRAKWKEQLPWIFQFLSDQGRIKFLQPIYIELYEWTETRAETIEHFKKTRSSLMTVMSKIIDKILHI